MQTDKSTFEVSVPQSFINILALTRIALGLIMFWSFIDKLFGLGFATQAEQSWLAGVSPTTGYLLHATRGPMAMIHQQLAGNAIVDMLFMGGLLGIGVALILGIGIKTAGYSGTLLMLLLYTSMLPPEQHPFIDHHIIYGLTMLSFTKFPIGDVFGLGRWWKTLSLVKKYPILQ